MEDHENDLPMMANVSEIIVYHFILDLKCELDRQELGGSIVLHTKPKNSGEQRLPRSEVIKEDTKSSSDAANTVPDTALNVRIKDVCDFIGEPNSEVLDSGDSGSFLKEGNPCDPTINEIIQQDHQYSSNISLFNSANNTSDSNDNHISSVENNSTAFIKGDNSSGNISNKPPSYKTSNSHAISTPYQAGSNKNCNNSSKGDNSSNAGKSPDDQIFNKTISNQPSHNSFNPNSYLTSSVSCSKKSPPKGDNQPSLINKDNMQGDKKYSTNITSNNMINNTLYRDEIKSNNDSHIKGDNDTSDNFCMILDANDIDILSVEEMICTHTAVEDQHDSNPVKVGKRDKFCVICSECCKTDRSWSPLKYSITVNCIRIWKQGVIDVNMFPGIIRINFKTLVSGQSMKWTLDQDGRHCVYTHGNWINNRSLFPSQDHPVAMATWEATVTVSDDVSVIMSGDDIPEIKHDENGYKSYHFKTSMAMPSSTLSLAVGYWTKYTIIDRYWSEQQSEEHPHHNDNDIQCCLYSPEVLLEKAKSELELYVPVCLKIAIDLLGPYPFKKLDIVIVPSSFDSLGMASPGVLYLSQSLIHDDYSMLIRLSHEVSHTWFGIVIGPEDWTEEWLTEGFCTYTEDIIHYEVMKKLNILEESDINNIRDIRDYLKYRNLVSELQNTKEDLQTLRPNKDAGSNCDGYVKNGMNPDKRFIQVHYLKGYFLLRYLEQKVGQAKFLQFIRQYVQEFYSQLVSSKDVIKCLFDVCPELRSMGLEESYIYDQWLDYPGLPHALSDYKLKAGNVLVDCVINQIQRTKEMTCHKCQRKKIKLDFKTIFIKLGVEQLMLFLELVLDEEHLPLQFLYDIRDFYKPQTMNAEVQHRWCELVIKHKCKKHYADVHSFLINHQAMGVYLFGEMVISRDKKQKHLAEECFNELKDQMEPDPYKTVHMMLFGF